MATGTSAPYPCPIAPRYGLGGTEGAVQVWPGNSYPLGASYDGVGTNFALFSQSGERVELCLFDDAGSEARIQLPEVDGFVHHGYVPGISPGQRYGYRVHGPWDVVSGRMCNPHKLLLDPYGKAVDGDVVWNEALYGYERGFSRCRPSFRDSAPYVPKSVITNPYFDWADDRPPRSPYHETVLYQVHIRGMTLRHPAVPEEIRGTYTGLAHPAIIEHLSRLGVTAVQLMPVYAFISGQDLIASGLSEWAFDDAMSTSSGWIGRAVRPS